MILLTWLSLASRSISAGWVLDGFSDGVFGRVFEWLDCLGTH